MDRIFSRSNDCRPRMRSRSTLECWHSIISLVLLMAYTRVEGGRGRRRAAPGIRAVTRSTGAAGRWPARRHLQAPGLKASATKASGQVAAPVSRHAARAPMGGRRKARTRASRHLPPCGTAAPHCVPCMRAHLYPADDALLLLLADQVGLVQQYLISKRHLQDGGGSLGTAVCLIPAPAAHQSPGRKLLATRPGKAASWGAPRRAALRRKTFKVHPVQQLCHGPRNVVAAVALDTHTPRIPAGWTRSPRRQASPRPGGAGCAWSPPLQACVCGEVGGGGGLGSVRARPANNDDDRRAEVGSSWCGGAQGRPAARPRESVGQRTQGQARRRILGAQLFSHAQHKST